MSLTNDRCKQQLTDWVKLKHQGQLIKRTSQPYFDHLIAVAKSAEHVTALGFEIGLCHDLLEDTRTTAGELVAALISFGYPITAANKIASCVIELTDVYTADAYPDMTKNARKKMEAARLLKISHAAQSVKYGDLLYNINWMMKYDQKHAKKYLQTKQLLLEGLNKGDQLLRQQVLDAITAGLR